MLQTVRLLTVPPEGTYHGVSDGVWTGPVRSEDEMELAFIKALPLYKLTREVVCALVASACGLPVLRPAVVSLEDAPFASKERYGFGTQPVEEARPMGNDDVLLSQLSRWRRLDTAIAFDAWIANPDRTARNLLFRETGDFVLIDHGEAIPSDALADTVVDNRLAKLASPALSAHERAEAIRRVKGSSSPFHDVDFGAIEVASLAPAWGGQTMLKECCRFLVDRLDHLDALIEQALGSRQQAIPFRSLRA